MFKSSARISTKAGWLRRNSGWTYVNFAVVFLLAIAALAACADANGGSDDQAPATNRIPTQQSGGSTSGGDPDAESINVAVTMPFLPSMVDAVGGDRVEVRSIVPQGTDAHTYQPSPGDARMIADADLIFVNGFGLEEFLDGLIESAGGAQAPVVELSQGLPDDVDHHADDQGHANDDHHDDAGHDHDHADENPHFWLSPVHGIHYVETIAAALIDVNPENEDYYLANAESYIAEIEEFDEWAREEMARIPEEYRKMVTFHDAFPYFADHYGLEVVGVVIRSPGRDPGAQELAQIVDDIRDAGVPAVFIEPQFNPLLAETIAEEAGVSTHLIYSDAPPEGAGYLEMMRLNVEQVVEGLS